MKEGSEKGGREIRRASWRWWCSKARVELPKQEGKESSWCKESHRLKDTGEEGAE